MSTLRKIGILADDKKTISEQNIYWTNEGYMRKNQMFTGVYI